MNTAPLALPYKATFLTNLEVKFYFPFINKDFIFVTSFTQENWRNCLQEVLWMFIMGACFLKKDSLVSFPLRFHIFRTTVTKILELSLHFSFDKWQQPTISTAHRMEQTHHAYLAKEIIFRMKMSNIWQCILETISHWQNLIPLGLERKSNFSLHRFFKNIFLVIQWTNESKFNFGNLSK